MNTIVVHGSALTSTSPRDIDVIYTESLGETEAETVRIWARTRGLASDLPIDAKRQDCFSIYVPQPGNAPAPYHVLAGDAPVHVVRHDHDLPALIRSMDAPALTEALRGHSARLCIHDPRANEGAEWTGYTQGLEALRNAIRHCPSWSEVPAAYWMSRLAEVGPSAETIASLAPGSQAGAGDAVICIVREDGLHSCYGDVFVPWASACSS